MTSFVERSTMSSFVEGRSLESGLEAARATQAVYRQVGSSLSVVPTYVAMLRGINVGGRNRIKMPVLEALFAGLGHTDIVTYIQSGNVVFTGRSKSAAAVIRGIEERITSELGLDVKVLLRSRDELAGVAAGNPFLRAGADAARLHVTFLAGIPDAALVRTLEAFAAGPDEIRVRGRDAYLHCPDGYGNTKLNNAFVEKRLQATATTRNWNSVTKLLELSK
jgi:uncharacterized protein (DUF1697 family)